MFGRRIPRDDQFFDSFDELAALLSPSHGGNDAQKPMSIVVAPLVSVHPVFANQTGLLHHLSVTDANTIPRWIEVIAYTSIALATPFGGWRMVHTMGSRITKLRPVGGFCAGASRGGSSGPGSSRSPRPVRCPPWVASCFGGYSGRDAATIRPPLPRKNCAKNGGGGDCSRHLCTVI